MYSLILTTTLFINKPFVLLKLNITFCTYKINLSQEEIDRIINPPTAINIQLQSFPNIEETGF